ncbi:MAG: hypothetical protein MJ252_26885, partial [archaeon]|nr:hypothetical protein [archaeon]
MSFLCGCGQGDKEIECVKRSFKNDVSLQFGVHLNKLDMIQVNVDEDDSLSENFETTDDKNISSSTNKKNKNEESKSKASKKKTNSDLNRTQQPFLPSAKMTSVKIQKIDEIENLNMSLSDESNDDEIFDCASKLIPMTEQELEKKGILSPMVTNEGDKTPDNKRESIQFDQNRLSQKLSSDNVFHPSLTSPKANFQMINIPRNFNNGEENQNRRSRASSPNMKSKVSEQKEESKIQEDDLNIKKIKNTEGNNEELDTNNIHKKETITDLTPNELKNENEDINDKSFDSLSSISNISQKEDKKDNIKKEETPNIHPL